MWFIRFVKTKNPQSKQRTRWFDKKRAEAEKWGVKSHQTFFTLGRYDAVTIFEAPAEKTAMCFWLSVMSEAASETLVAVSREEVSSWMK